MSRNLKDGSRSKSGQENSRSRATRHSNADFQRAIEGLKDIPDNELQEFLDDEEFMQDLNVVDAWDGEEELVEEFPTSSHSRNREPRRISRDRSRRENRGTFQTLQDQRDRLKREDTRRRRDDVRRDPTKSSKDIERDKIRTKKDTDNKALAEKEKAIKHLLDSDTVVPPGTEEETIETEKQNIDPNDECFGRNKERRRSLNRHRISPGHRRSTERINRLMLSPHREPNSFVVSPEHRRSSERSSRKTTWDRRISIERRARSRERRVSLERHRRRLVERELRIVSRRSRSRERHRSRSQDRYRKRWSRSPGGRRGSPRRRSVSKSPDRRRKRSPFINELARAFRDEALLSVSNTNQGYIQQQQSQRPLPLMATTMHIQVPQQHYLPHQETLGPPAMAAPQGFNPYEAHPSQGPPMSFESMPMHSVPQLDYNAGNVVYNPTTSLPVHPQIAPDFTSLHGASPQPVPAPNMDQNAMYNQSCVNRMESSPNLQTEKIHDGHRGFSERGTSMGYHGGHKNRRDRLKTPEPPVISESKQMEKTSLSSLLEASVSAKDSSVPVLYPGFKPEILRHCELALRDLPDEDPRLKIKGRFFFDPTIEEPVSEPIEPKSNSILLQKNKCRPLWSEILTQHEKKASNQGIEMHQKYCQTEFEFEDKQVQTELVTEDFCVQVCPGDLQPPVREEKRPIMDRLDWNVRETYDYCPPKVREVDDLRWSLNNSSQKRSWNRGLSSDPPQEYEKHHRSPDHHEISDHEPRDFHRESPIRNRESFSGHRNSFSPRERFSPYRRDLNHHDEYHDVRSELSREESPLVIDEHDDEIEILDHEQFSRETNWRGNRGGKSFGQTVKSRMPRGKYLGSRPYRGRGGSSYRGKY